MHKTAHWLFAISLGIGVGFQSLYAAEKPKSPSQKPLSRAAGAAANARTRVPDTGTSRGNVQKASAEKADEVLWAKDPKSAYKMAQATGQPMLLVFSGKRCSWCRKLERETLADSKVVDLVNGKFIPLHIDVDEHPEISEALEVEGLPTTVVLTPDGEVLASASGFQPASKYQKTLKTALAKQEATGGREIQQVGGDVPLENPSKRR